MCGQTMLTWVIYDITENKIRNRIVKLCKDYGLYRVQKSVFIGDLNKNLIDSIILESKEIIDESTDSTYIFPMCNDCFKKIELLGKAFDKDLVSDEVLTKFF